MMKGVGLVKVNLVGLKRESRMEICLMVDPLVVPSNTFSFVLAQLDVNIARSLRLASVCPNVRFTNDLQNSIDFDLDIRASCLECKRDDFAWTQHCCPKPGERPLIPDLQQTVWIGVVKKYVLKKNDPIAIITATVYKIVKGTQTNILPTPDSRVEWLFGHM